MELMFSIGLGAVTACAVYLLLRGRTFPMVLGLSILSSAANLFIFSMGRLRTAAPPIINAHAAGYADPLPQALVLTGIVIGFGMTGFIVALAVRLRCETDTDHVDGMEAPPPRMPADES